MKAVGIDGMSEKLRARVTLEHAYKRAVDRRVKAQRAEINLRERLIKARDEERDEFRELMYSSNIVRIDPRQIQEAHIIDIEAISEPVREVVAPGVVRVSGVAAMFAGISRLGKKVLA